MLRFHQVNIVFVSIWGQFVAEVVLKEFYVNPSAHNNVDLESG